MSNQRTAAIAIHRIGIRFACALLLMSASSLASGEQGTGACPQTVCQQIETLPTHCIRNFRQSAAGGDGCELEDVTVDGNTCILEGACPASGGDWIEFNFAANINSVDDLRNCDGELRVECSE